tara:strand:- start:921 stop:1400 length:480 start_codon:yes stop_codon:yes gene_type:complete
VPADSIQIEVAERATDDIRRLIAGLDAELTPHYEPEQGHALSLDALFAPDVRFFVAHLDGQAMGCGGVGLYDGYAEVKRMFAAEAARGRGVASAVLRQLEETARAAGYSVLRLETGIHQHAAIAFYKREGFTECEAFGPYREMTPHAIATSLFFEKALV